MDGMQLIYAELAASRVNVEVMFSEATDGPSFVTCRLRPWKGNRNAQSMVLAGGSTCDEAIYHAYCGLYRGVYIPLDWSARATSGGVVNELPARATTNSATGGLQVDPGASFGSFMGSGSGQGKNGQQKASQGQIQPLHVVGRNKPKD